MTIRINADGLEIIKRFEDIRLNAYIDNKSGKVPTIGWGHTKGVKMGDTCTREQADAWLAEDVASAEADVARLVKVPLTSNQASALTSFVYNIGGRQFATSTMLRLINGGEYVHAGEQFKFWVYDNKVKQPGLVTRRAAEAQLWRKR